MPEGPRSTGMALASMVNWAGNTAIGLFFPMVQAALGDFSFVPFSIVLGAAFAYAIVYIPETRGKTPAELVRWYNGGK